MYRALRGKSLARKNTRKMPGGKYSGTILTMISILILTIILISILTPIVYERSSIAASSPIFSRPVKVNDDSQATAQGDPDVAFTPSGNLLVAWRDERSGKKDVFRAISSDAGNSFGANAKVNLKSSSFNNMMVPSIAYFKNFAYVVWQDNYYSSLHYHIYFAKSTDGGNTFGGIVKVDDKQFDVDNQLKPDIIVAPSGKIIVAWIDERYVSGTSFIYRVRMATSENGGLTFSSSFELPGYTNTSNQRDVSLAINYDRVYVAYTDDKDGNQYPYMRFSLDEFVSFSKASRLDDSDDSTICQGIKISALPGNSIFAVWEDNRNGNFDIYGAFLSRRCNNIGSNVRIDDAPVATLQRNPSVAVSGNGTAYVVWEDKRTSDAIRFSYSFPTAYGNRVFAPSIEVSSPGSLDSQEKPSITTSTSGMIFIAYQDNKDGSDDIYFATGQLSSSRSTFSIASSLLIPILMVSTTIIIFKDRRMNHLILG